MKTILFQGDSITDAGRSRDNNLNLGIGYARFVEGELGATCPGEYKFINRGISGNRVVDLYARIKADVINLKPDYMSVLIGVNDVWHEIQSENGVDAEKFYKIYSMFIEEVKAALPDIKIMILEPFVLKAAATEENWERFRSETLLRAKMAKRIAEEYNLKFISLQEMFDEAEKSATADYWLADGVHPSAKGHHLIKNEWLKAFNEIK